MNGIGTPTAAKPVASQALEPRLLVLAPFGISNEDNLERLSHAVGVRPERMDVVVRGGRPSLSATRAGAQVLAVQFGTRPRQVLRLAADGLKVWRLARNVQHTQPCLWVDRGWIGPYELLITVGMRLMGITRWRLVYRDGGVESRSSGVTSTMVRRVLADNLAVARKVGRAAERVKTQSVPARARGPIRRGLYMRLDLPLAISHEPGGSLSHSEGIIGGLQDAGVDVWTVAPVELAAPGRGVPTSVRVDFVAPRNLHPELAEAQFNRDIARQLAGLDLTDIDFVYERYSLFGFAGLELAHRLGVPLILEANASEVRFRRQYDAIRFGRSAERFEKALFENASLVLAVSQRVVDDIKEIAPRAQVLLVPNGVDPTLFSAYGEDRDAMRKRLGYGDADVVVGFVGRFYAWHGVQTLAEAAADFLARSPGIRLLMVGDGDLKEVVERLLAPWSDRVRFTGIVGHSEVPGLMTACDILVSPHAPMEGFIGSPMKVFEYLASGRAVIASRLEQIADVVQDGVTGLLVEPGDVKELSTAVLHLAQSPELRKQLGAAAQVSAFSVHAWPSKVKNVLSRIECEPIV